jgi:hypothetical protein
MCPAIVYQSDLDLTLIVNKTVKLNFEKGNIKRRVVAMTEDNVASDCSEQMQVSTVAYSYSGSFRCRTATAVIAYQCYCTTRF